MLLVDTNVLLDVFEPASPWFEWSSHQLRIQTQIHELSINPVVYAEVSPLFDSPEQLDSRLDDIEMRYRDLPRDALFLAGHVHRRYRQAGGVREQMLPDFIIGAHAMVL